MRETEVQFGNPAYSFVVLANRRRNGSGMLKEGLAHDGFHPNTPGYAVMVPVVEAAIQKALK